MAQERHVFIESDSLGIDCPVTVGYFTKVTPELTHLANFHDHLVNQLMMIDIAANTAIELALHLKDAQLDAKTNGNDYVPILPNFKIYWMRLSHSCTPSQVTTEVLGIKGMPQDAKLLGKFFVHMASDTTNDNCDGIFLPKGTVHLLGPQPYAQVLQEQNLFLTQVATIPVNLEYDAWFAVIDLDSASNTDPILLQDHLLCKLWFLRIESVGHNKCLIVTTKPNLPKAHAWINKNLESMIWKLIPLGIDPPLSLLPHLLDKPVYTATSQSYADILKKQFSLAPNSMTQ